MEVLVVEDEPLIRLGLVSLLEEAGLTVMDAPNADGAVRLLEANAGVSVLVTDVDMPGSMDGAQLAHLVRQRWPGVAIIAISGKVGVDPGMLPPGARFFSKPVRDEVLISAIARSQSTGTRQ